MSDYGTIIAPDTIRFERLLPGPIERVWSFLVDSDKRGQWLASGVMEPRAEARFALSFHHANLSPNIAPTPERFKAMENGATSQHRVLRAEPPRLLSFTWSAEAEVPSEVTFELEPEGDKVRLVLTHRRLPSGEMANTAGGWHTHLAILADKLAGRTPPSFWTLFEGIEAEYGRRLGAL
ncbi:MAG: ATPase [Kaistia sp. SCN 65-12]|nr:MAG: ATPase [Kaistia sp. SCN 65-12]